MDEETGLLITRKRLNQKHIIAILSSSNICLCITLLLLILLIIGAYFLYPRIPNSSIENVNASDYSLKLLPPAILLLFTFDVVLNNDNYYDIKISNVDLKLFYQGATLGNFSLQYDSVAVLEARLANQTIPMKGSVNAASTEVITDLIQQATLSGYNVFLLSGTITMGTNFLPNVIEIPIQSEMYFFPDILPSPLHPSFKSKKRFG